jgi:Nickel responsive protein SCO4226-like
MDDAGDRRHRSDMPKYIIERELPGAGKMGPAELQAMSKKSCSVLAELPSVQWLESFVTTDKIYCVYIAPNEDLVREHAKRGGFPADRVSRVATIIDPTTAGA